MKRITLFPALLVIAFSVACDTQAPANPPGGDPSEVRKIPSDLLPAATSVVESNNAFALQIYGELKDQPGNLLFSPFSISTALAMTYAGASGVTEAEMAGVLRLSLGQDRVHPAYGALVASLGRGSELGGYELSTANAIWPQAGYGFLRTYLDIPKNFYDALLEELDYAADPEGARRRINTWVDEKTRERIRDLLPPGSISIMTRLVLTNAIYFKGAWASPFDPEYTTSVPFWVERNETVEVPMMYHEVGRFRHARLDDLSVLAMPYEGEDLSMLFLLPHRVDGLSELEAELTPEGLAGWISSLHDAELEVRIPQFKFTSDFDLTPVLKEMGMPSACSSAGADFSKMTGSRELYISKVVHKAFVEVNEEGTEAAAATGVVVEVESIPAPRFEADHPFLFLIHDHVTGSILFLGRVVDPSA